MMLNKKIRYTIGFYITFIGGGYSQLSTGGIPMLFLNDTLSVQLRNTVPSVFLPSLNNDAEKQRADSIENSGCVNCDSRYYGSGITISIDIKAQGQMTILPDSSKLWLLKIESETAHGLEFYFDKYRLPDEAELFFYNQDSTTIIGAFTSDNNPEDENKPIVFGTQPINGNAVFIEYREPKDPDFYGELRINTVIHIFIEDFLKKGPFSEKGSAPCNINVSCSEGAGWEKEINSVVLILGYDANTKLTAHCSDTLINNTNQDGRALLLTAKHCIEGTSPVYDYSTWMFLFNHQTSTCSSDGSDVSSYTGQSVYGSTLLAEDGAGSPTSDYLLLDLGVPKETLKDFGACFAGWNRNVSPSAPFTGIHHPSGDVKKISIENNALISTNRYNTTSNTSGDHWMVSNWDKGATEGGSSGSALFDNNHRIIGQLRGGDAACIGSSDNGLPDWYGKFSTSWQNGGFSFWLDPANTGQTTLDTYCPADPNSSGNNSGGNLCAYGIGLGMTINGVGGDEVPCLDGEIILRPINAKNCASYGWRIQVNPKKLKCKDAPNSDECKKNLLRTKCTCYFYNYFIEIAEVTENKKLIGFVKSKWFSRQVSLGLFNTTPDSEVLLSSIKLNTSILNALQVTFENGKYYRIKLAEGDGRWDEDVRYFRYLPENITITGTMQNSIYAAKNIHLSNVTVNTSIDVVASKSIHITPNSSLKAGRYRLDDIDCQNYNMKVSNPISDNTSSNVAIYNKILGNSKSENQQGETNVDVFAKIYPNPNDGQFTVELSHQSKNNSTLSLMDLTGRTLIYHSNVQSLTIIDLSNYSKGIYFVQIQQGEEITVKKVVYN